MRRCEAENKLLNSDLNQPAGTYLIRMTDSITNGYCLSVKTYSVDGVYNDYEVKHYKIEVDPVSSEYCLICRQDRTFRSLDELICDTGKFNFGLL